MATPERFAPSRRLRSAAASERDRLRRQLERLEHRAATLRSELTATEEGAAEIRRQLGVLDSLAVDEHLEQRTSLSVVRPDDDAPLGVLKGVDIRVGAVRILAARQAAPRPVHYTGWYDLVRQAGYGIGGRDPLATFLTQITRSPVVQHAGAPGMYVLDLGAPERLRERLHDLHEELAQLHMGQQAFEDITTVRQRRLELTAEYDRAEQALAEAIEALGLDA